jgi:hypothetical protein
MKIRPKDTEPLCTKEQIASLTIRLGNLKSCLSATVNNIQRKDIKRSITLSYLDKLKNDMDSILFDFVDNEI